MAYIDPPLPSNSAVMFTDAEGRSYTWGEHRRMEKMLDELEANDESVREARERLDETLLKSGFVTDEFKNRIKICEHCRVQEFLIHKINCPDYSKDLRVTREAGGYQYLDDQFKVVWTTSIPRTDEFALAHFKNIQLMHEDVNVTYILRRAMHEDAYKMMPFRFDRTLGDEGEVVSIGK